MNIKEVAEKERDTVITLRRHFHENPELSQQEFKTMDFIEDFLHQQGIETVRVPRGGVFGFIDSGKPGWTILLRADIDALPIQEDPVNLCRRKKWYAQKMKGLCMPAVMTAIFPCSSPRQKSLRPIRMILKGRSSLCLKRLRK